MTAREYLNSNDSQEFKIMCELAKVKPTVRQVRKYRNHRGQTYRVSTGLESIKH
jgi:hypothetical protein